MRALIPSHDPAAAYVTAAVTLLSLSCGSLAALWRRTGPTGWRSDFLTTYVIAMALVTALALIVLDAPTLAFPSSATVALGLPVGIIGAFVATKADDAVRRAWRRRRVASGGSRPTSLPSWRVPMADRPIVERNAASGSVSQGAILGLLLVLAAVLEELLYRGILVALAQSFEQDALVALALVAITAAFALSHIELGWEEVLAKVPLGVVAMVSVLALGHVLPAVVTHALFNARVWVVRNERERASLRDRLS